MNNKTCVIIAGPTAVGKTAAAIEVARHFNTEIISADSRQCFKEMAIGVAKPSSEELQQVHHYFIGTHSIHDTVNAAVFEQYALQTIDTLFQQQNVAVVTGGTGLYIKAFCEGLDDMPPLSPEIRTAIQEQYQQYGLAWLQQQVKEQDPLYYASGEILNPQRLMRALEVKQATGQSIRSFQQQKKINRPFNIIKLGLELPRPELHTRINTRVDKMMEQGLLQEAQQLLPYKHLNALQTVGYTELYEYLDGNITLQQAIEQIKTNTRHYAKRQMTWFKKDAAIQWFSPNAVSEIIDTIDGAEGRGQR
ncbi:tRNA (adenosine(37)-N6)-dimethylallyltransferase MiaA [Niastella yeongjuensis]|uniref:tRNA dimethylallyltransferase n=1 Tax=Niastella yeongjuensis TaxID=354355 RepID=A0A1V9E4B6_9BACT|nr:tRNA (adenosine(37)-N6)-dimethylallyltransferase MiaA [Niastella yeongjuensis]OQP40864.1 tRNA (adenosine(37)-N6)-dimethylallyltransferase MiaA [Niastella yeongjuensis]SEO99468.1 tRNA dimethylallyltransferase [Niastella yeongjuensis]